jgi:predicted PurR-regulated permease PerM
MSERNRPADSAGAAPDVHKLARAVEDPRTSSWALTGLLVLAVVAALYLARDVLLPMVLALILSLVFAPFVRGLKKLRIPESVSAALVVVGLVAAVAAGVYNLAEPAADWLDKAPQSLRQIGTKLRYFTGQVKDVTAATDQVEDLTQDIAGGSGDGKATEVTVKAPTLASMVVAGARDFAVNALSTLVLLYFLLASGDLFLRKIIAVTPRWADKKRAVDISRQIEAEVSKYLFTVAVINTVLGGTVALAMYFLGVPNPVLWGAMVGVLNFVPYLGDITSFGVLTIVGLLTFDELWRGLLVPGVFYLLTATEGYLITPLILGRRMSLNPVVILLSVLFWGWMWGILGALLAVPILVAVKTFCNRVEPLQAFGEFLGA